MDIGLVGKRLKISVLVVTLALAGSPALGQSKSKPKRISVNSMCHMKVGEAMNPILGDDNVDKKYPLASISKVVTSFWAIKQLGANYRYQTRLHLTKIDDETFDLHIEGGLDPIMGRNAAYFITSELNRSEHKVKKIRNLTFDQNFLMDWLSEEKPRIAGSTPYFATIEEQTASVKRTLESGFITPVVREKYRLLQQKAASQGVIMTDKPGITAESVRFVSTADHQSNPTDVVLIYRSAPLYKIIKRMNNQSNNYIADHLFWSLGGIDAFNSFVEYTMQLDGDDFEFYLGSGNNAGYIFDPNENIYNKGSCSAMVKTLYYLDQALQESNLDLSDVMAVAGEDHESTVRAYGGSFFRSTVAKTGSVNVAKTLAGSVKTREGTFYFAILVNTKGRSDWGAASSIIRTRLDNLIKQYGGPVKEDYREEIPLPFDKKSSLINLNVYNLSEEGAEYRPLTRSTNLTDAEPPAGSEALP